MNLLSAKKFFLAAMLLRDEDKKGTVLFHSVIFNSVGGQIFGRRRGGAVRSLTNIYCLVNMN